MLDILGLWYPMFLHALKSVSGNAGSFSFGFSADEKLLRNLDGL